MDKPPAKRAKLLPLPDTLVSWYDLSPELIARMSRYVDIGHDLTGLCVVVGSDTAARIKRAYLTDNDAYLAYALALVKGDARQLPLLLRVESVSGWLLILTGGIGAQNYRTTSTCGSTVIFR